MWCSDLLKATKRKKQRGIVERPKKGGLGGSEKTVTPRRKTTVPQGHRIHVLGGPVGRRQASGATLFMRGGVRWGRSCVQVTFGGLWRVPGSIRNGRCVSSLTRPPLPHPPNDFAGISIMYNAKKISFIRTPPPTLRREPSILQRDFNGKRKVGKKNQKYLNGYSSSSVEA